MSNHTSSKLKKPIPLVVDLDGTLINSDLLIESTLGFVGNQPLKFYKPLKWLKSGKANLKSQLAQVVDIDVSLLPYNEDVITLIKEEKNKGRQIVLATASHTKYANKIAEHLKLFDMVLATDENINLSSIRKCKKLVEEFGEKGFDYVGNSKDDLIVWSSARTAYIVNPEPNVVNKAKKLIKTIKVIKSDKRNSLKVWAKELRIHQWMKNLLIFVPLLASHNILNASMLINGVLAFLFFGLCASSVYLFNDLLDLNNDRQHTTKKYRPIASGLLSIKISLLAIPILLIIAFIGSLLFLPWQFFATLAVYFLITLVYSLSLKQIMIVDVITLSILYTLRIIAGTWTFDLILTFWMLAFSMFVFLSLALLKRHTELAEAKNLGLIEKTKGRGYYPDDLEMISSLGAASGYISVLVLAFYIQDKKTAVLYNHPQIIWLACPLLLFWISRIWMLSHRRLMHDDPIVFAIKDKVSIFVGVLFFMIFWFAI